jgi:hypothetical protein
VIKKTDAQKQEMKAWRERNKERLTKERESPEHKKYKHEWYLQNKPRLIKEAGMRQKRNSEKHNASNRKYCNRPEIKALHKIRNKLRWDLIRKTVLEHYGNTCVCCGETRMEFLAIDHINGGGSKYRKEFGCGHLYHWLLKNNYPDGHRILCHNCNTSLGHYGYCPHGNLTQKVNPHGKIKSRNHNGD